MQYLVYIGIAMTVAGLVGLVWCIRRAVVLKAARDDSEAVRRQLYALVAWNTGAVMLAFFGLGVLAVGLILG